MIQQIEKKQCRDFGMLVGGVFTFIGLWPMLIRGESLRIWALGIGSILIVAGAFLPSILAPVYRAWMWIGHILGWINTRILLGVVFYGIVTPIGILFRLMGKDEMRRRSEESSSTYRVVKKARPREHMRYQF